jgi:2-polyprenyl-6-hydroxyphenyl methylase/3-demethylubiquinone-9 3-methyltransferase
MDPRQKPYYRRIQKSEDFLDHYLRLYDTSYEQKRVAAIKKLLPKVKNKRILDVGCGGGFYSFIVAKQGACNIVGVDLEKACIKAAQLNLDRKMSLSIDGVVADTTKLPFRNESFDLVLCVDVIEHVEADRKVICELFGLLKPQGFLVISSQNSFSLNFLLEGFFYRIVRREKWMGWDTSHVRFYNPKSFSHLLQDFKIFKIVGTYYFPYMMLPSKFLRETIMKLNQFFETRCNRTPWNLCGWGIACLCKK